MSGWNLYDKMMEENTGDPFPAVNNITIAGYLPSDQVPAPGKSKQTKLISFIYSSIPLGCRSTLQESTPLQKMVSIHAFHHWTEWHAKVH